MGTPKFKTKGEKMKKLIKNKTLSHQPRQRLSNAADPRSISHRVRRPAIVYPSESMIFMIDYILDSDQTRTTVSEPSDTADRPRDLAGAHTPSTNVHMAGRTVDNRLHTLHVGLPSTIGTPVRV